MSGTDDRDHIDAEAVGERLYDVLRKWERNIMLKLSVAAPGTLVTYDPATQTGDVRLGFRAVADANPEEVQPPLVIPGVRVQWYRSANAYIQFPITAGATGWCIFADRCLDNWWRDGGAVDPGDARAHSQADAVFFPTAAPDSGALPATSPTDMVLEAPFVLLGEGATDFVALAQKVLTELQAIKTWADTHTHTYNPGPSPPAPTTPPVSPMPAPGSVAATKAKGE